MQNKGVSRLAKAIDDRIKRNREAFTSLVLDTGTIQGDMSLLTDSYPIPIPQKDYYVNELLTLGDKDDVLYQTQEEGKPNDGRHTHGGVIEEEPPEEEPGDGGGGGGGDSEEPEEPEEPAENAVNGAHIHDMLISKKMRWLKPGDRVLVAWVEYDAFVIMRFLPATEIG